MQQIIAFNYEYHNTEEASREVKMKRKEKKKKKG
jgi:hypothetical protein